MQENSRNYGLVFFFSLMLYSFNLMRIHKIESDSFPDSFFSGYGAAPLLNLVSSRKSLFPFLTSVRFRKKALKRSIAGVQAIKLISITNFLKKLVYLDKNNKKSFNYKMRSYRIFRKLRAAWFNKKKKYKVRFIARARRRRDNALNTILVNFLKHYRRQLRVIRKSTVNHPIFYYMKPRIKRFSQKV
ncbi:MAG TPA: hypothetical protein PKD85_00145 [Saprospiraceae bacterium]|nr:hypothetical protein [Saprospiraceae bacterium]